MTKLIFHDQNMSGCELVWAAMQLRCSVIEQLINDRH